MLAPTAMPDPRPDVSQGTIVQLWRYPVKSMLGEHCVALQLSARGVEGDRQFAIRTAAGTFGSGKSTRRFTAIPGLFAFHARYADAVPVIACPDGQHLRGDDPTVHAALSAALGQTVTLAEEGVISHFDAGPVHLLTTAALAWLQARLPAARIDARRFRPNVLIDLPSSTQVEQQWGGQTLALGDTVRVRVSVPTKRCVMVTFAQAELPRDPAVLRCITQEAALRFGVYAEVVVPGRVSVGDDVQLVA